MSAYEIFWGLLPWCLLALFVASTAALAALIAYHLIYRRLLHGVHGVRDGQLFALAALCGYVLVVLGLTLFSRASGTAAVNLTPFYGYFDAFATGSLRAFQLIVFNVMMFVPLGLLLPLISKRLRSARIVLLCALLFSLCIETLQLLTSAGIFELDDLFHNTLGGVLGYLLYASVASVSRAARRRSASAACAVVLFFGLLGGVGALYSGMLPADQASIEPASSAIIPAAAR